MRFQGLMVRCLLSTMLGLMCMMQSGAWSIIQPADGGTFASDADIACNGNAGTEDGTAHFGYITGGSFVSEGSANCIKGEGSGQVSWSATIDPPTNGYNPSPFYQGMPGMRQPDHFSRVVWVVGGNPQHDQNGPHTVVP